MKDSATKQLLTYEDIDLLSQPFPDNPCDQCFECKRIYKNCDCKNECKGCEFCIGCDDCIEYNRSISKYKEAGIYEYALSLKQMEGLAIRIRKLLDQWEKINSTLPEAIQRSNSYILGQRDESIQRNKRNC